MKKIFTLIAALFAFTATFAQTETELTLTEGHTLLLSTIEAAGGVDSDIVRFYIENTSGESREGWGIGGFANSDNWTPTVEWVGKAGTEWTYDYTVSEIKTTAGTTPGEWHDVGITINIYNGCKVTKCTLVKGGTTAVESVVAEKDAENAPIYNLAGQRVDKSFKGVVIQNGKKFIQK